MADFIAHYARYLVPQDERRGALRVRSLGTTTLLFDDGDVKLLFDGMVTRPSLTQILTRPLAPNGELVRRLIERFGFQNLNAIFVSHTHYDHVLDVPVFAGETGAAVYGSPSTLNVARGNGLAEPRLHDFTVVPAHTIGRFTVTVLPSRQSKPNFFNNDLGVEITAPLPYPARSRRFTEGGSYDFLIAHGGRQYLIRPSCNYIPGQLAGLHADVLFLGVGGIDKLSMEEQDVFYRETIGQVHPEVVIPVHWDNFFLPLRRADRTLPRFLGDPFPAMDRLIERMHADGVAFFVLPALNAAVFET